MLKFISKILGGNKSEKDVAAIRPIVEKINQFFQQYQSLTNDELRNKTVEFKQRIKTYLSNIDAEIAAKNRKLKHCQWIKFMQKMTFIKQLIN
jgi:preprotein translocase subunit SecA